MALDKKTLIAGVAVILALGAGYGIARITGSPDEQGKAHGEDHDDVHGENADSPREDHFVRLTPDQATAAGIAVVTVGAGGPGDLRLTGRVEAAPHAKAVVAAPVSGSIERVLVAPGDRVAAGAGLATLRSAEAAAVHAEAAAAAAEAQAADASLAREDRLFKAGVIARQDLEAAQAAAARASAAAVAARARVNAYGSPTASGQTVVRSPIAGIVTGVQAAPGGFVAQGSVVAEISNPALVEVVFNAPAEAAAKLRVGAPLRVVGPDGGDAAAVIIGIAPLAVGATGSAIVRARPSGGGLPPGAAVSASVAVDASGLPSVPSEAVQRVEGRSVVFVLEGAGFRARPVTPGRSGAGFTQVVSGLKGGERVAGRGAFVLKAELAKGEAGHEH